MVINVMKKKKSALRENDGRASLDVGDRRVLFEEAMTELCLEDEQKVGKESRPAMRRNLLCLKKGGPAGVGLEHRDPGGMGGAGRLWRWTAVEMARGRFTRLLRSAFAERWFHWK